MRRRLLVIALPLALVGLVAAPASAKAKLSLQSPDFHAGGTIPQEFTCVGDSTSPALVWSGVPKKTKEFALTMEDPDTARGTFVHWVVFGIDRHTRRFDQGAVPEGVTQGANGANSHMYLGPCPPTGEHRYIFTLYALSKRVKLDEAATIDDLRAAIKGTVKAKVRLIGRFSRS